MIYWTIQRQEIVDMVLQGVDYYPDFKKSQFVQENSELLKLYNLILDSFNDINRTSLNGLIFTFMFGDEEGICHLPTIELFQEVMCCRKNVIQSLWNRFKKNNYVIVKLELEQNFNPIFIDINDFQFLMPPIMLLPPYTEQDIIRLTNEVYEGIITPSVFPSNIIQAHIPCIKKEYIKEIYEMFDLM